MSFWTDLLGLPHEIKQVDVKGVNTRVLRAGRGEAVVFLHGISGHFECFVPVVKAHAERYEVHALDMLGHGYTDTIAEPLTVDRLAQHVVDYLDVAGLDKVHLVGLSLGGWTAAWIAAHFPERIRSTVLIAAAGDPQAGPGGDASMGEMLKKMTRAGVLSNDKEDTRKRLRAVVNDPKKLAEEMVDVRYDVYHRPSFAAALDSLLALTDRDTYLRWSLTPDLLARIQSEVLVVYGDNDKGEGVSEGRFLVDGIARVKRVIFMKAGHWPPYERPAEYAQVALAFLDGGLAAVTSGAVD